MKSKLKLLMDEVMWCLNDKVTQIKTVESLYMIEIILEGIF